MEHSEITPLFIVWVVTTQCVNFTFYLALTKIARGWWRTLGAYFIYFALLAAVFPMTPMIHGGAEGTAGALSVSFISFFCLWGMLTILMSPGVLARRFFAVVLCGIHQLIAFAVSLLLLRHVRSAAGPLLASALMAGMGWLLVSMILPRIRRMPDRSGWFYLNAMLVIIFAVLYSTSVWPVFVAGASYEHILVFATAAIAAFAFFPTALAFSEKNRQAASMATLEDNLRLMSGELTARREVIAEARQIRQNRRDRRQAIIELLKQGKNEEALAYLERLERESGAEDPGEFIWCENETVNAVLAGYSRKAATAGLRFSAMASVNDRGELPEVEMVELVSNLLEIAIRTAVSGSEVRCILRQRSDSLGVTVTNAVAQDFRLTDDGLPFARADEVLENIYGMIGRYEGKCRYRLADGLLVCDAMFSV